LSKPLFGGLGDEVRTVLNTNTKVAACFPGCSGVYFASNQQGMEAVRS